MPDPLIEASRLTRRFGRRTAVNQVSFTASAGEVIALIGPNGSGKTTLLKLLAGFLRPDGGSVRVLGFDPYDQRVEVMRTTRFAFAPPAWYEQLTARENLAHLTAQGRSADDRPGRAAIEQSLVQVGLADRADERVRVFSFGMRQRLALAQALLPLPRLLILDEPTDGLDPLAVLELRAIVMRLRTEHGLTILLASHLLVEVERMVDRLLLLEEGRPLFVGSPSDLLAGDGRTRLTVHGDAAAQHRAADVLRRHAPGQVEVHGDGIWIDDRIALVQAQRWLADADLALTALYEERPTLEQAVIERLRRALRRSIRRTHRVRSGTLAGVEPVSAAFELLKLRRSHRPIIAAGALVLFVLLMLLGFYTYAQTETGGRAEFRYTFENRSYFNGLTFAIYAFYFGVILLFPIFAAVEGGAQIAGETGGRTLPLLLARPVSRERIFFAKWAVSAAFVFLTIGFFLALVLLVGLVAVGWGELRLYPGVLQMTDRPQTLSRNAALCAFACAWPAATLAVMAPLALSLLISTLVRSAVNAVGISVSVYLVLYLISEIHFFRELRPFLFTADISYWRGLFRSAPDWADLLRGAARLLAYALLFLGLAHWRFRRREET